METGGIPSVGNDSMRTLVIKKLWCMTWDKYYVCMSSTLIAPSQNGQMASSGVNISIYSINYKRNILLLYFWAYLNFWTFLMTKSRFSDFPFLMLMQFIPKNTWPCTILLGYNNSWKHLTTNSMITFRFSLYKLGPPNVLVNISIYHYF